MVITTGGLFGVITRYLRCHQNLVAVFLPCFPDRGEQLVERWHLSGIDQVLCLRSEFRRSDFGDLFISGWLPPSLCPVDLVGPGSVQA